MKETDDGICCRNKACLVSTDGRRIHDIMRSSKIIFFSFMLTITCLLLGAGIGNAQNRTIPYTAALDGAPDEAEDAIRLQADTFARVETPPRTAALLRKRVAEDIPTIRSILQALGYFKIRISSDVDTESAPAIVTIRIEPGPVFRMGTITMTGLPDDLQPSRETLGLPADIPATSAVIRKGNENLITFLGSRGYPFARITSRDVIADHAKESIDIHWKIEPGPQCTFGPVTISGLEDVDPEFVHRNISWKEGNPFNATQEESTRIKLLKTSLFGAVRVEHAQTPAADGSLPMTITLKERVPRTVKAGLEYATDTGPGATFSWEHRNLFHQGERLRFRAQANDVLQSVNARLMFPSFFGPWQLTTEGGMANEDTDAYASKSITAGAILERKLTPWLRTGGGVRYRLNRVGENDKDATTYGLLSFPLFADAIKAAPILDPTSGWTLKGETAPYVDTLGQNIIFLKSRVQGSTYLPLLPSKKLILALRGVVGTLGGTGLQDVPADERFYAGGGGSVRGYGYQKAGELDDDDDPTGGLSTVECTAELRARFTNSLGGVLFLDGGRSFADSIPQDMTDLFWGAGAGLRYFTPIGPIRLDLAFPLERRDGIDDAFQIYISIGQAF